ncbi:Putative DNA-binding domain protein [uncultured archaeon]|nr:Putative DNA-binding domain protein [uncultured archaeon]
MLYKSIEEIIKIHENQFVEFKERIENNEKIAEEIVAFSNTNDGDIIIGITNSGEIIGIDNLEKEKNKIINICTNNCFPPINPILTVKEVENKKLLIVSIRKSVHLQTTNTGKVMIRRESSIFPAKPNEIENLVKFGSIEKKPTSFDIENLKSHVIKMRYENFFGYRDPTLDEIAKEFGRTPEEIKPFLYKIAKEIAWVEPTNWDIDISDRFCLLNKYEIEVLIPTISKSWIKDRGSKTWIHTLYHNELVKGRITNEMKSYRDKRDYFLIEHGFLPIYEYERTIIVETLMKYNMGDAFLVNQKTKLPEGIVLRNESIKKTPIFALPIFKIFLQDKLLDSEISKYQILKPFAIVTILFLMSIFSIGLLFLFRDAIALVILLIMIPLYALTGLFSFVVLKDVYQFIK